MSAPILAVKEKKMKFSITQEEVSRVPVTETLVGITDFCDRISDTVGNPNMYRLSTSKVTEWLLEKDFLQVEVRANGKNKRQPTPIDEEVRIITQE